MIATSINQSKKLLELGLDPKTADMHYFPQTKDDFMLFTVPFNKEEAVEEGWAPEIIDAIVPAWTLSVLLDLVPEDVQLTSKGHTYQAITIKHLIHEYYPSAIDAVYNLLCVIYGERVLKIV